MKFRLAAFLLTAGIFVFLVLTGALVITRAPWWDEGFMAGPSQNLATLGVFGSHVLTTYIPSADRYLYWNLPLYFVVLSAWFKVFGFGVYTMRILSVVCALASMASWYVIMIRLLNDRLAAALTVFLLGTDYVFIVGAVSGRMDMMTACFGVAGLAAFLSWRESSFNRAILVGALGAACAVFCHPLGLIYAGVISFSAAFLDWRRIRVKHVFLAAIPFVMGGALWALYILKAPEIFSAQMSIYSGRFHAVWNPVELIRREIVGRYLMFYYTLNGATSSPSLARFKVLGLIPYVAGFFLALSSRALRSDRRGQLLILLFPLSALLLGFGDYIQYPQYFLHDFPFALALLAAGAAYYWEQGRGRILLAAFFVFVAALGSGGILAKIRLNEYQTVYRPTISSILPYMSASTLVDGPCELIFALGDSHVVDGMSRESYLAHKPDFIVVGRFFGLAKVYDPEQYELTYRNREYSVYRAMR
jgi:4-amino-4-deoxy-L-arabinose transferase-like glycosyltransferase